MSTTAAARGEALRALLIDEGLVSVEIASKILRVPPGRVIRWIVRGSHGQLLDGFFDLDIEQFVTSVEACGRFMDGEDEVA